MWKCYGSVWGFDVIWFVVCIRSVGFIDSNIVGVVYEFSVLEFDLKFFFYRMDIIIEGINGGIVIDLGVILIIFWI